MYCIRILDICGGVGYENTRSSKTGYSVGALGFEPRASATPLQRASRTAPRPEQPTHYSVFPHGWQARFELHHFGLA
jgi:hypothetical protein